MDELDTQSAAALAPDVNTVGASPDAEVLDRDVRTTPQEMTLARFVYGVFLENERFAVEKGFHDQMRESWRVYRSELSEPEKRKLAMLGIPADVTDPLVEVRGFAALSQLKEIFASSGQFPCKISSTAHPDVPEFITERTLKQMLDELQQIVVATGVMPSEEQVAQFGRDRKAEILNAEREHARDEIDLLERRVRDDFEEADFLDAFNQAVEYMTVFGTTLFEGPVPCIRWKNEYGGANGEKISRKAKPSVAFRAINPLDVYPAPDQTSVEDGPICIRVRYAPQDLWLNSRNASGDTEERGVWFKDTVDDLLAKYQGKGVKLSWQDGEDRNRELRGQSCWIQDDSCMMEGISYYGQVKGNLLIQMGVSKAHDGKAISPDEFYEVNALVIDEYCVYCRIISPCMGRPLSKAQFYSSPDNFFGGSLSQRLIAYQRIMNGSLTALVVNMNMTCAPIVWIDGVERLQDKTANGLKLVGGKVYAYKRTVAGMPVTGGAPMGVLPVQSRVKEVLDVMNAAIKRVDDVSGIPSYTYGQNVTGGAGRTYSGLAMLTEAANRVMKMIIDGLDRNVIRRVVKMDAYRLMLYDDSIGYTGDVEVNPTGVMGLILKQQEMQKVLQLMQMVANSPVLLQRIPPRGLMELFRQVLETYDIANIDKIVPSKPDLDLQEYVARLQQLAQGVQATQAQQVGEQPNLEGGATPQLAAPQNLGDEYAGAERAATYSRGGTDYAMPVEREPAPGSANERRGAA